MVWLSYLLLLALSGVAFTQAVQPVTNLQAFGATKRGVSYTFTASPTSGASYEVTFIPQRAGIPQPPAETFTSGGLRTKSGLVPDVDYRIQVVAVVGGVKSTAVTRDFTTEPDVPTGPPLGLAVASRTTTSITVTWRDPGPDRINDRDGVTGFVVRRDGEQVATVTVRTYTFTGLTVATSYRLEVLAVNEQGTAPNNHAARLTATTASGVPNPPALRVVLPRFSNTYLVWRDPEPFVGDILGVQIRYLIDCISQNIPELGREIKHYSVSGIKNSAGKTHSISLRARTSAGCGSFSTPLVFTFQPIAEVEVAAVSCDKLKLSYTVNPLPSGSRDTTLQSLVVRYQAILRGSPQSSTVPLNGSATEGVLCISGLTSNTGYRITYSVEVNVADQDTLPSDVPEPIEVSTGRSCDQRQQCQESSSPRTTTTTAPATSCTMPTPPSCPRPPVKPSITPQPTTTSSTTMATTQPTAIPTTAPPGVRPVSNLQAFGATKRGVSYTFTASPTSGASYKVTFIPQRTGIPQPQTETFTSGGLRTKSGLVPDVTYRIQVVAVLSGVESTAVTIDFTTQPDVPTGPPQSLTVASRTNTSITVTWRNPSLDRINDRDGVTGFVVRRDGRRVATVTDRTYTFTGLTVATSYRLEVLAVNEQGTAPNNHAARVMATTASGVPNPPALQVVLPRFSNTYLVWRDPEPFVGDILGVQIRYLIDCIPKNVPELGSRTKHYSVSGIKSSAGKTHSISVRARTSAGYGSFSKPLVFTFQPIAEVEVAAVSCDKLKLSYTVNPLPSGSRDTTLQSLVVKYQAILGGSPQSRTVPLNGRAREGVLCISGLASNTGYRITYSVEVNVVGQDTLPSDVPEPIEVSTGRTCDNRQQCQESSSPRTTTTTPPPTSCTTPTSSITPQPTTTSSTTMTSTRPTTTPTTPPVDCGDPGTPTNGRRTGSSTTYNSVVTYTCNTGYTRQGSNRRTCQSNGQWSGSLPRCNRIMCPKEVDSVWKIQWPATAAGSSVSVPCVEKNPKLGMANRLCNVKGVWAPVDAVDCESAAGNEIKMKTDELLKDLKDSNATLSPDQRNMFRRLSEDLNMTSKPDNKPISPQDLKTVASFMKLVANLGENNGLFNEESNETQQLIGDILSKVFDDENTPAFEAFTQRNSSGDPEANRTALATSILRSSERVASAIANTINNNAITVSRPNFAMVVQRFSINSLIKLGNDLNWKHPNPFVPLTLLNKTESFPVIHFPPSFLFAAIGIKVPSENDSVVVVNMVMNNIGNYLPTDVVEQDVDREEKAEDISPASLVLSIQILGYDGGEVDSSETVTMTFPINKKAQDLQVPPGRVKQFRCAFFNFSGGAEQTGAWSYRGVETVIINETHVQCTSSHLTSFVVFVMTVPAATQPPQLDSIIYIGCVIAFLCLLACIIFYVIFVRKELFQNLHNFVHFNLCFALSLGLLVFIFGIQLATANTTACKVVTALMHYFFLATFTWTLCEAVLICFLLVKVFGANNKKWIFLYLTLGWALPIPVVVLTGGIRHDYYLIRSSFDQDHPHYDNIKACWFPTVNGMIFTFIVPMALIIVVNAVLLAVSLLSLATSQFGMITKEKRNEDSKRNVNTGKCLLMTNIIIVPVLVFTWIMGLFAVEGQEKIYAILFVLANVLQGLFILLLYVVLHEKVFKWIKGRRSNSKMRVTTGGGSTKGGAPSVTWMDKDDTGGSCTVDKKNAIEFEEKQKDEDEGSIQGEDVDTAN